MKPSEDEIKGNSGATTKPAIIAELFLNVMSKTFFVIIKNFKIKISLNVNFGVQI